MLPFRGSHLLPVFWLLFAGAAVASPLFDEQDLAFSEATEITFEGSPASPDASADDLPLSVANAALDLPQPHVAAFDSRALFRALLLGRDLRGENGVETDLVAALPRLREERGAEIRELRGDARDPSDFVAELSGPRVGMR
jgi:hypothetical protein